METLQVGQYIVEYDGKELGDYQEKIHESGFILGSAYKPLDTDFLSMLSDEGIRIWAAQYNLDLISQFQGEQAENLQKTHDLFQGLLAKIDR